MFSEHTAIADKDELESAVWLELSGRVSIH